MGIVVLLYISRSQNAGEIGKLMASVNYMTQVLFALTRIANVINVARARNGVLRRHTGGF